MENFRVTHPSICFLLRFHSKVRYRVYKSLFSDSCQILKFTSCISKLRLHRALIVHFLQNKLHDENGSFTLNVNIISYVDLGIKTELSSCSLSEVPNIKIHIIPITLFLIHSRTVEGTQIKRHVLR